MKQNHTIREIIHELEARVRSNRRWRVVATCLASVVVFTTVYLLVLPAITMETSDDVPGIQTLSEEDTALTGEAAANYDPNAESIPNQLSDVTNGDAVDAAQDDGDVSGADGVENGNTEVDSPTAGSGDNQDTSNQGAGQNNAPAEGNSDSGSDNESGDSSQDAEASVSEGSDPIDAQGPDSVETPSDENAGIETLANISGTVIDSGTFQSGGIIPKELTWTLWQNDAGERVLTISGEGAMPDYTNSNQSPWYNVTHHNLVDIVIEDGITHVGNYAFTSLYPTGSLTIGKDVTSIGEHAFQNSHFSEAIIIPEGVKTVGNFAFAGNAYVPEFTFEEGVESIGEHTLQDSLTADAVVHIPSTMTQFSASSCRAAAYEVAEGNAKYFDEDGILYSLDGTKKLLLRFPRNKQLDTFVVPDFVTEFSGASFQYVNTLRRVEIPNEVHALLHNATFSNSSIQEISIGTGVDFEAATFQNLFSGCTKLERLDLPDDISPANTMNSTFTNNYVLREIEIPKNITSFGTGDPFSGTSSLEHLIYNAADATTYPESVNGGKAAYTLTIGSSVDHLGSGFSVFAWGATSVSFEPNNLIRVDEGAFDGLPIPLNSVSGLLWVDDDGVVYALDEATSDATLIFVPAGLARARVIDPLRVDMGNGQNKDFTVTAVRQNALAQATSLQIISFDDPKNIETLEAYSLGNCPSLITVRTFTPGSENDPAVATDIDEAKRLFANATIDDNAFFNSGLTDASGGDFEDFMTGVHSLVVAAEGASNLNITVAEDDSPTARWSPHADGIGGGWRLLTGATLKVNASVGNIVGNDDYVYRVFVRRSSLLGTVGAEPGTSTSYEGQTVYCRATDDPYVVCFEFVPAAEGTVSFPIDTSYASPTTPGGGVVIWGVIEKGGLSEDETVPVETPESWDEALYAFWDTDPDTFEVKKSAVTAQVGIAGDGKGTVHPASGLSWTIRHDRIGAEYESYGKDYVVSYDIRDQLTALPQGVSWSEDVINDIKQGNVTYFTSGTTTTFRAGDIDVATVTTTSGASVNFSLELDDDGQPVLSWTKRNTQGTPIGSGPMTFPNHTVTILPEALVIDMATYNAQADNTVTNTAFSKVHYHWRDDYDSQASGDVKLGDGAASLALTKTSSGATYFGEDIDYSITLQNTGASTYVAEGAGSYTLVDTLSENNYLYLKPENIEALFEDCPDGVEVEMHIDQATLDTWEEVQDAVDAKETAYRTPGNTTELSGDGTKHSLVITKSDSGVFVLQIDGREPEQHESVASLLQDAGYDVTGEAAYSIHWILNSAGETFEFAGGKTYTLDVHATAKSSFELVGDDWPYEYPAESSITPVNVVELYDENGLTNSEQGGDKNTPLMRDSVDDSLRREATISKEAFDEEGNDLSDGYNVGNDDIIEYQFTFEHFGSGSYDHLPFVDDIYGTQALMVEKARNTGLDSKGLDETRINDIEYFILNKPGTYENVVVGSEENGVYWTAATVEVTSEKGAVETGGQSHEYSGLHTAISWYRSSLPAGSYQFTVSYQTYVDSSLSESREMFSLGNIIWANDKQGKRLYDAVWGGGSIIKFDKDIVERGKTPDQDVLVSENGGEAGKYSIINDGEKVTYRLELENDGNATYKLTGNNLADALPRTFNNKAGDQTFYWRKEANVTVDIVNGDETTNLINMKSGWYLGTQYAGIAESYGQQYILWPENAYIDFAPNAKVYIYVTLTFPMDTEDELTWSNYVEQADGATILNTLWVYRFSTSVTHSLGEDGYALLQKGVYDTSAQNGYLHERNLYNNQDSRERAVTYYVTLLNAGSKRLYLNTVYDNLPRGFTFKNIKRQADSNPNSTTGGTTNSTTTVGGIAQSGDSWPTSSSLVTTRYELHNQPEQVTYRSAAVTASTADGMLKFSFGAGTGEYAVQYDEEVEKYYLDRGEAIVFAYTCTIGEVGATDNEATNIIGMSYSDYLSSDVISATSRSAQEKGIDVKVQAVTNETSYKTVNDGVFKVVDSEAAASDEMPVEPEGEKQWLMSEVKLNKGGIRPTISKRASSYTDSVGNTYTEFDSVPPNATVEWTIQAQNDGTQALLDYVIVDRLPKPFVYSGSISNKEIYALSNGNESRVFQDTQPLLFIPEHTADDEQITVTAPERGDWSIEVDLTKRDWHETYSNTFKFRLYRDDEGREVLELSFTYRNRAIPENGGYSLITVECENPSSENVNTVYTNTAQVLLGESWKNEDGSYPDLDTPMNASRVENDPDERVGAENNAAINVAFGLSTTARKGVTEVSNADNSATSTGGTDNTISLSDAQSTFDYTLEVENTTGGVIDQLVLIDSLPAIGDTSPFEDDAYRNSAFRVDFADNPNVRVTIEVPPAEGSEGEGAQTTTTDLVAGVDFSVTYQAARENKVFTDEDWRGQGEGWTSTANDARSIRVVIGGLTSGYSIAKDATVRVTFRAVAEENATPGALAWNNFGYRYNVATGESSVELSALSLPVGVRVPTAPILTKQVVDDKGNPVQLEADQTFKFVIYTGGRLSEELVTDDQILETLASDTARNYRVIEVTVPATKEDGTSDPINLTETFMDAYKIEGQNQADWSWVAGETYYIDELECPSGYEFVNINSSPEDAVAFTYSDTTNVELKATNREMIWSITVNKIDGDNQTALSGAVFALYSPEKADALDSVPDQYEDYGIELELDNITPNSQAKGYLVSVITTADSTGSYTWNDLKRDRYYLLEVAAPQGYVMPDQPGQVIYRDQNVENGNVTIDVENFGSFELPSTGGSGTTLLTLGGVALMGAACIAGYRKRSRKGDGPCC